MRVAARARVHLTTLPPQVRPWNGGTTRDRRDGEYYGAMWQGTTNLKPYSLKILSVKPSCEMSTVFLDFPPRTPFFAPLPNRATNLIDRFSRDPHEPCGCHAHVVQ